MDVSPAPPVVVVGEPGVDVVAAAGPAPEVEALDFRGGIVAVGVVVCCARIQRVCRCVCAFACGAESTLAAGGTGRDRIFWLGQGFDAQMAG